jgi:hypothetical protein
VHHVAQANPARAASHGDRPARAFEAHDADPDNAGRGLAIGLALSAALWALLIGGYFLLR